MERLWYCTAVLYQRLGYRLAPMIGYLKPLLEVV